MLRASAADPGQAPKPRRPGVAHERPAVGARRAAVLPPRPRKPAGFPWDGNPAGVERSESRGGSARTDERGPQVLVDGCFRDPEGASHADRFQLAGVH